MNLPDAQVILASGYFGQHAFRDRILLRHPDGSFRDLAGEVWIDGQHGRLTKAQELELVPRDILTDLDDSLDPWDLRIQLRALANAPVTTGLERTAQLVAATAREVGGCIDSDENPWFEPSRPSDDRYIPLVRAGYYGIWDGFGFRIRMLPGTDPARCELIAYAYPEALAEAGFTPTDNLDAPFIRTISQAELTALYTVEGRALVDRHLVTICGSRPGRGYFTAQEVPEPERVRQVAAASRFIAGEQFSVPAHNGPILSSAAVTQPLPETIEAGYRAIRSLRMDRTEFIRTTSGWQGDWRTRRPAIYLPRIGRE